MPKTCSNCGAISAPEARFCRRCGTALNLSLSGSDNFNADQQFSTTVPLSADDERRTGKLAIEASQPLAGETIPITSADLGAHLQSPEPTNKSGAFNHPSKNTNEDLSQHVAAQPKSDVAATTVLAGPTTGQTSIDEDDERTIVTTKSGNGRGDENFTDDEDLTVTIANRESATANAYPQNTHNMVEDEDTALSESLSTIPARRRWLVPTLIGVMLICFIGVVGVFVVRSFLRPVRVTGTKEPAPIPTAEPKHLIDEKIVEAESLLASGDINGAVASLREAIGLDPSNNRARWRLAEILLESGKRKEAIEEYREITRIDPNDLAAWRMLASSFFVEGAYAEAADSYRRLLALVDKTRQEPHDLLAYADSLRLAGLTEESHKVYQELSLSSIADVANAARLHLSELSTRVSLPTVSVSPPVPVLQGPSTSEIPNSAPTSTASAPTPSATPTPDGNSNPSATDRYASGVELWSTNRASALAEFRAAAASGNPDAYYYLGLSIAEGRDPLTLNRAELVAALSYFQLARRGRFGAEAQRYEAQLGKEYDRRRNQQ